MYSFELWAVGDEINVLRADVVCLVDFCSEISRFVARPNCSLRLGFFTISKCLVGCAILAELRCDCCTYLGSTSTVCDDLMALYAGAICCFSRSNKAGCYR